MLYSDDDPTISVKNSLYGHRRQYAGNPNVQIVLLHGKGHDVVRSDDAVAYRKRMGEALRELRKWHGRHVPKSKLDYLARQFDQALYWQQDDAVWHTILTFLDEAVAAYNAGDRVSGKT